MRPLGVLSGKALPAQDILALGHRFQVIWVHAEAVPAEMVELQPLGNGAFCATIHHSVGVYLTIGFPPTISASRRIAYPFPTAVLLDDIPNWVRLSPVAMLVHLDKHSHHTDLTEKRPETRAKSTKLLWHRETGRCAEPLGSASTDTRNIASLIFYHHPPAFRTVRTIAGQDGQPAAVAEDRDRAGVVGTASPTVRGASTRGRGSAGIGHSSPTKP